MGKNDQMKIRPPSLQLGGSLNIDGTFIQQQLAAANNQLPLNSFLKSPDKYGEDSDGRSIVIRTDSIMEKIKNGDKTFDMYDTVLSSAPGSMVSNSVLQRHGSANVQLQQKPKEMSMKKLFNLDNLDSIEPRASFKQAALKFQPDENAN